VAFLYLFSIITVAVISGLLFDWIWSGTTLTGHFHAHHPGDESSQILKLLAAAAMVIIFLNARYNVFNRLQRILLTMVKKQGVTMNGQKTTPVLSISIPDMNCAHCSMKITNALKEFPQIASLSVDLNSRQIQVETSLDRSVIIDRIRQEGYQPQ